MTIGKGELRYILRQYNTQMSPDRLARILGDTIAPGILTRALDIAITRIAQTGPVHLFVDGWCKNNGQPGAQAGWSLAVIDGDRTTIERSSVPKHLPQTSNVAEYCAVIEGLRWGSLLLNRSITLHTDSALVVGQVTKGWKVKAEHLMSLVAEAKTLVAATDAKIVKEPREKIVDILGH